MNSEEIAVAKHLLQGYEKAILATAVTYENVEWMLSQFPEMLERMWQLHDLLSAEVKACERLAKEEGA